MYQSSLGNGGPSSHSHPSFWLLGDVGESELIKTLGGKLWKGCDTLVFQSVHCGEGVEGGGGGGGEGREGG